MIVHDKYLKYGRLFKDTIDSHHKQFQSKIGQENILDGDNYKPYIWDSEKKSLRFGQCELLFTALGIEIRNVNQKKLLSSLSFNCEMKSDETWDRFNSVASNLHIREIETDTFSDEVEISYDLISSKQKNKIKIRTGGRSKAVFSLEHEALEAGMHRVALDFDRKGEVRNLRPKKDGTPRIGIIGIDFPDDGVRWKWEESEISDRKIEETIQISRLGIAEGYREPKEIVRISPDTWGQTGIAADADDGEESGGGWSVGGYDDGGMIYLAEADTDENAGLSWALPAIAAGATINKEYVRVYDTANDNLGTISFVIRTEDSDPDTAVIWDEGHVPTNNWINTDMAEQTQAFANDTWYFGEGDTKPLNINGDLQDLVDTYGAINSGDRQNIAIMPGDYAGSDWGNMEDYSDGGTNEAELYIDWTEAGGVAPTGTFYGPLGGPFRGVL